MSIEELIGSLPNGWEYSTLGETCAKGGGEVQTGPFGSQLHASDYVAIGIPSIMPQNIGDNRLVLDGIARITPEDAERLSRYRVRPGDIVYSRRGDVERRALIRSGEDGWLCGTGCLRVRVGKGHVDPRYTSYYLGDKRVREWIVRHAHGATMANLNTSILSNLPFVVPPTDHQRAVGDVLGGLDDKIDLNQRMNNTLEAMARAIFKDWFVEFGPTRAKAEGRLNYLAPELRSLFPSKLDDKGKPIGWRQVILGEFIEFAYGKALKAEDREDGHVPVFGSNGRVGWHNKALALGPGIVVGRKGNPGTVKYVRDDFFCIDTTFYVVPKKAAWKIPYLWLMMEGLDLPRLGADSAVPGLNREIAYRAECIQPDEALVERFSSIVEPLLARVAHNDDEVSTLSNLRDFLLPRLISGKITLKAAEKKIEEIL